MRDPNETYNGHLKRDILAINNGGYYINEDHLLIGPKVTTKLLPEAKTQPKIVPRLSILHSQAGSSKATNEQAWGYANRPDVVGDAHFYGPDDQGAVLQALPLNVRADSQYKANRFNLNGIDYGALCMETQDNGSATLNKTPWNWPQVETSIHILVAECFWYQFSCGPVGWYLGQGIAPHNAFPEWSLSAHSCPGTARTKQMDGIRQQVAILLIHIYQECGETCPGM